MKYRNNEMVRLMDCLNFKASHGKFLFDSQEVEHYRKKGSKIIHWLPSEGNIEAEVLMPSASAVRGMAESSSAKIKVGEIVQFTRFGFCRLERKENGKLYFIYCHD